MLLLGEVRLMSLYDRFGVIPQGARPEILAEWSETIEKRAIAEAKDSDRLRIRFEGTVNDEGKFALDVAIRDTEAMVCVLRAIQECLALMPTLTREFYGALMISLAQKNERTPEHH